MLERGGIPTVFLTRSWFFLLIAITFCTKLVLIILKALYTDLDS